MRLKLGAAVSILAVVLALALPALAGTRPAIGAAASLNVIGPQDGGGEPSTVVGPDGTIYVSAPGNVMEFFRSVDHGVTWTKTPPPESPSGDTSVNTDASGAVYQSNLHGVEIDDNTLQVDLFKSFDKGDTWPQRGRSKLESDNSTGQPALVDRQWVDAWIPPGTDTDHAQVYITYHDWGPSQVWVSGSMDGGRTFDTPVDVINSPLAEADSACNTIPGGLKIVPAGPHRGRIIVVWLAADAANVVTGCNVTQAAAFHSVWSAYSDDQGQTWTDQLIFDAGPLHDASEIFADLTLDNRGNPYVAFPMNIAQEFDIWVEASFDGGQTWNGKTDGTGAPYRVNANTGTHYFAAIAAGDPGKLDVAYLRTPTVVPTAPNGKPQPNADNNADWNLYVGQTANLLGGHPTWQNQKLSTIMHDGDICTLGVFCAATQGNRNLLDFIDIAVDGAGRFHISYTDDKNYPNGALVMANQTGGPTIGRGGH